MSRVRTTLEIALCALLLAGAGSVHAQDPEQMLRDGIALHDQGEYEEAAKLFSGILELFPEDALAAYELALTYATSGQFQRCVDVATSSLAITEQIDTEPDLIGGLYLMLASCHSNLGDVDRAIEVFDTALALFPDSYDLHFNKAISEGRRSQFDDAVVHLQQAVSIDPRRPSPYYILGANYMQQGQDVLAMLSYLSFLQIEFNTPRCVEASRDVFEIMFSRVRADEEGVMTVAVDPEIDAQFEGLMGLDFALATAAAAHTTADGVKEPVAESMTETLSIFVKMTSQLEFGGDPESFIGRYLLPNTRRLNEAAIPGAFAWYVAFVAGVPGTDEWPQTADADEVSEYLNQLAAQ